LIFKLLLLLLVLKSDVVVVDDDVVFVEVSFNDTLDNDDTLVGLFS
jgi:hypothetical protein